MFSSFDMLGRLRVAAIHFCISAFVVLIAGFLLFLFGTLFLTGRFQAVWSFCC